MRDLWDEIVNTPISKKFRDAEEMGFWDDLEWEDRLDDEFDDSDEEE